MKDRSEKWCCFVESDVTNSSQMFLFPFHNRDVQHSRYAELNAADDAKSSDDEQHDASSLHAVYDAVTISQPRACPAGEN